MDYGSVALVLCFVSLVLAMLYSYCVPGEEERNADAEPQLAAAVQPARTLPPAEHAGRLASAAAAELGYFPYSAAVEGSRGSAPEQKQLECVICLEAFVQGATCSEVPSCRHLFHRDCIARWMRINNSTCPLCRDRILPGSEPLSAAEDMV